MRWKRLASGFKSFHRQVCEAREDHSDDVIGREWEIGDDNVGFELVDDSGEHKVR